MRRLRFAFGLEGTLVTEGYGEFPTERPNFWQGRVLNERLRSGTIALLHSLQREGVAVGIYLLKLPPLFSASISWWKTTSRFMPRQDKKA